MKSIHLLTPVAHPVDAVSFIAGQQDSEFRFVNHVLQKGPISIESDYDEVLAGPDMIKNASAAEREGASAIVLNCVADPSLAAIREAVNTPVVGCGQVAMHFAALLGHKFSILPTLERRKRCYQEMAIRYGLAEKLASVRPTNIPVRNIDSDPSAFETLLQCTVEAILEDEADVIIFGCTHFAALESKITFGLKEQGLSVPIINPLPLAVEAAKSLVRNHLKHSKIAYPLPPQKEIVGYVV
ncbi:Asp/Glu racemase [Pseudomaricurvus alkylphenolicus]|uniref:aspartate/glutamate racemase family protein n=1 Tax=Pseudomaricurvus alkylphenolicus TaxID=1306991 RepID=UPI001423F00B|nr:aspartate/glutamate racemase family protein [Pseudomaricurvus alkylphenolicus]NIB42670.1 Asp/Glu racemase [Pseudomaricurvus alkylphenolicus]